MKTLKRHVFDFLAEPTMASIAQPHSSIHRVTKTGKWGFSLEVFQTTTGHLNVDLIWIRRPAFCDSRAAVMISTMCRACSGVNGGSLPVARHSATTLAPCSQLYPFESLACRSSFGD